MHEPRSPHLVRAARVGRVLAFATALAGLTGFVVADVLAAEGEEPRAMTIAELLEADPAQPAPLLAVAVVVPDAVAPVEPPGPIEPPEPKNLKKKRKIKFGRFDSY